MVNVGMNVWGCVEQVEMSDFGQILYNVMLFNQLQERKVSYLGYSCGEGKSLVMKLYTDYYKYPCKY